MGRYFRTNMVFNIDQLDVNIFLIAFQIKYSQFTTHANNLEKNVSNSPNKETSVFFSTVSTDLCTRMNSLLKKTISYTV